MNAKMLSARPAESTAKRPAHCMWGRDTVRSIPRDLRAFPLYQQSGRFPDLGIIAPSAPSRLAASGTTQTLLLHHSDEIVQKFHLFPFYPLHRIAPTGGTGCFSCEICNALHSHYSTKRRKKQVFSGFCTTMSIFCTFLLRFCISEVSQCPARLTICPKCCIIDTEYLGK